MRRESSHTRAVHGRGKSTEVALMGLEAEGYLLGLSPPPLPPLPHPPHALVMVRCSNSLGQSS